MLPSASTDGTEAVRQQITIMLDACREGSLEARDELIALLYQELRAVAKGQHGGERVGHTWQTTEVLHEAYIRLFSYLHRIKDRKHLFACMKTAMHRALVSYARRRRTEMRTYRPDAIQTVERPHPSDPHFVAQMIAMEELSELHPRQFEVVESRFYLGLTIQETAESLGVSHGVVESDWAKARAFLRCRLRDDL